jgi:ubiquitin-protein ligase
MFQELSAYKTGLPVEYGSSIFVRAVEGRLDLLRALIIGPDDSPYAGGCFVFDIYLDNYPANPPKVQFLTTGGGKVRFNPNLYNCGKVCLSLLGTWQGPGWISGESTLLQVLVSIQSLILVNDPYFNEPGYASSQGTPEGTRRSEQYNANIRKQTMLHAILPFCSGTHPFPEFNDAIEAHYRNKKKALEKQLYQWMAKDSSLMGTVNQILPNFARFHTKPNNNNKSSARAARAVAPTPIKEVDGVIQLLEDDEVPPVAKKQKSNEVVNLLDDEEDSKPAASAVVGEPAVLDLT